MIESAFNCMDLSIDT
uniref:Uncharacterized protein n=1 Tax=Anguilla anguilla TaxID=7936 RepID=A0A0E9RGX1_ANGAN